MPNPDKELTVEECLAELREMFPRYKYFVVSVSVGAPRKPYEIRVGSAYYSREVRSFYAETLSDAMAQIRRWLWHKATALETSANQKGEVNG